MINKTDPKEFAKTLESKMEVDDFLRVTAVSPFSGAFDPLTGKRVWEYKMTDVSDSGLLTTGTYGEVTRLLPVEKMRDYKMPAPMLTRSPGHMRDFIRACKGGDPACSNFDVAAPFVEWMLLGVIALRHEGKLEYDPDKMRITNNTEANKLLKPTFRKGWEFHTVKA